MERSWFLVERPATPLLQVQKGLRDYIIDEICLGIDQFGLQHSVARPGGA